MKTLTRILSIILTVAMLLICASCLAEEPVSISWSVRENANLTREKYQEVIDAFMADHPEIAIDLQLNPDLSTTVYLTMIAAGTLPDVISRGNDVINVDGILSEVPEWLIEKSAENLRLETEGAIRTIPAVLQGVWGVLYNKVIFAEAGIESLPTTWDEFIAVCDQLKAKDIVPLMGWGTSNQTFFTQMWAGASLCNELMAAYPDFNTQVKTGEVQWTDSVISENLKTFQKLGTDGYFYEGSNSLDYGNAESEFMAGNAAMLIDGVWAFPMMDPETYGVFILPDPSGTNFSTITTMYWAVKDECKNKDACWTFIDWLLYGNGQEILLENVLKPDSQISATPNAPTYEMDPISAEFYALLNERTLFTNQLEVLGELGLPNGFADFLFSSMAEIFFNGADVDSTLESVQFEYETLLEEQG